jgi:hypothetical protein
MGPIHGVTVVFSVAVQLLEHAFAHSVPPGVGLTAERSHGSTSPHIFMSCKENILPSIQSKFTNKNCTRRFSDAENPQLQVSESIYTMSVWVFS